MLDSTTRSSNASSRDYYDAFSEAYDRGRSRGYHRLIDEQAAELVRRAYEANEGERVLEVGCGTGLILERVGRFAPRALGVDLSGGMLARARARGLWVQQGSARSLPYKDATFGLVYAFKVLAHVDDLPACLREMTRVVRPGGRLVFDVYNRRSIRYVLKRAFGPRRTSSAFDESAIPTQFVTEAQVLRGLPADTRLVRTAGIRVLTPHAALLGLGALGRALERLEWRLMDSPLRGMAGFLVCELERLT